MCYEHYHNCKYCKAHYRCALANKLCPTINFDADKNMCDSCRASLEELVEEMSFREAIAKLYELGSNDV
jgi:hypothetical protein